MSVRNHANELNMRFVCKMVSDTEVSGLGCVGGVQR